MVFFYHNRVARVSFLIVAINLFSIPYNVLAQQAALEKAESLVNNRNFKKAVALLKKILSENKNGEQIQKLELGNLLAYSYASLRELDLAQQELDILSRHKNEMSNRQQTDYFFLQGYVWLEKSRYNEAIQNFEYAQEKCLLGYTKTSWQYARIMLFTGLTYRQGFFNNDLALDYLQRGLEALLISPHEYYEACLNYQIAIVYYGKGDFEKLNYYNFKAQEFFDSQPELYSAERAKCYNLSAIKTYFTGTLKQALQEYELGLSCLETHKVDQHLAGRFYDNMGVFCWRTDTARAIAYFRKGLSINRQYPHNEYWISNNLFNLGSYLLDMHQRSALSYLKEALLVRKKVFGNQHPEIGTLYSHIADYFAQNNQLDSALTYYNLATRNLWIADRPQVTYLATFANISVERAGVLKQRFSREKNIKDLLEAFRGLLVSDSIVSVAKKSLDWEFSQISLTQEVRKLYNSLIDMAHSIYTITGDKYYAGQAFRIMESVKYSSLFENLRQVPRYDKQNESIRRKLLGRIVETQVLLSAFEKQNDKSKISGLKNHFVLLMDSLTSLSPKLKNQSILQRNQLELDDVRKQVINNQNHILEYYESDSAYFVLSINPNKIKFKKIERGTQLRSNLKTFMDICNRKPSLALDEATKFAKVSNELYQNLIGPFRALSDSNDLVIVADGELSYLPFDALVVELNSEKMDFNQLSYLVRYVSLSTAFSLQILEEQKAKGKNLNSLARVVTYSYKDGEGILDGASKEVNKMKKYFWADTYTSKSAFKAKAELYNVHHFALHGNYDSLDKYKSGIVFQDNNIKDTLFAYELYGMDLPSKLVVLNSCESGSGVHHTGEGVFSLARGFSYSGASAVLMNLWKIPDVPVVYLTDKFYQYCKEGLSMDKALAQAKIAYLTEHDAYLSHPYFWSSLTLIGSNRPIKEETSMLLYGSIMLAFLMIIFLILYLHRKSTAPSSALL